MGLHHTFVRQQRLLKTVNASFAPVAHGQHDRYFKPDFFNHILVPHRPYRNSGACTAAVGFVLRRKYEQNFI
jgi:hypothetical protein